MSTTTDIRQRAIELIEQLPNSRLTAAINYLESLSQSSYQEAALLQIIQRRGLTVEEQKRLEELRDRNEWSSITEAEYQELLTYEDSIEQQNVERIEALMKLAEIRNTDVATLNHQLRS